MGDSEKYLVAAAYQDRGFSWKRSDKRVSTGGEMIATCLITNSINHINEFNRIIITYYLLPLDPSGFQSSFLVPTLSLDPIDVDLFSIARTVQHSNAKSLKTRHTG